MRAGLRICAYVGAGCGEPGHDVEPGGAKGSEVEDEVEKVDVECLKLIVPDGIARIHPPFASFANRPPGT